MTVDILDEIVFRSIVGTYGGLYTWLPGPQLVVWGEGGPNERRHYPVKDALNYFASGTWVVVDDSWFGRQEYPPIGTTIRVNPGIVCKVIGFATNGDMVAECAKKQTMVRVTSPTHIRPLTPTADELKIKAVADDLGVSESLAESIIAKGYTKQ